MNDWHSTLAAFCRLKSIPLSAWSVRSGYICEVLKIKFVRRRMNFNIIICWSLNLTDCMFFLLYHGFNRSLRINNLDAKISCGKDANHLCWIYTNATFEFPAMQILVSTTANTVIITSPIKNYSKHLGKGLDGWNEMDVSHLSFFNDGINQLGWPWKAIRVYSQQQFSPTFANQRHLTWPTSAIIPKIWVLFLAKNFKMVSLHCTGV